MSATRARHLAASLSLCAMLAGCAAPPPPDLLPDEVSVIEPVADLVARTSIRDLNVNTRCETVNALVFGLVAQFGADNPDFSEQSRAGAILIHGTLAQFFEQQVATELKRQGVGGGAGRQAQSALFAAYMTAYVGQSYPSGSRERRAQVRRMLDDLEYCNRTLAGLPL